MGNYISKLKIKGASKVDISSLVLPSIVLFLIVYFAVRLAIRPLLYKPDETTTYNQDAGLAKLRDMDVLSAAELDQVIKLYQQRGIKKESYEEYQKYATVLKELNKIGYFTEDVYLSRLDKLKKHFEIS